MALYVQSGGRFAEASSAVVLDHARLLLAEAFRPGAPVLKRPEVVEDFVRANLSTREHEVFAILSLDSQFRLIEYRELFNGTINSVAIHVREVVKAALSVNAACLIAVHNHPGGAAEPSPADLTITRRLKAALWMVEIRLLDHIVVGETIASIARLGLSF